MSLIRRVLALTAFALLPGCAHGAAVDRSQVELPALRESPSRLSASAALRAEYDELNVSSASLEQRAAPFHGHPVAVAGYAGAHAGNGFARGVKHVHWRGGQTIRYGISLFLPRGFQRSVQGQVDLMRWDNYPLRRSRADWGGISIWGADHRVRLLRFHRGRDEDVLIGPFRLPEGRWLRLTVVQRLGHVRAASEVYLDGRRVGRSLAPNTYGRPIQRVRYGLVAVAPGSQRRALRLSFSDPLARASRRR